MVSGPGTFSGCYNSKTPVPSFVMPSDVPVIVPFTVRLPIITLNTASRLKHRFPTEEAAGFKTAPDVIVNADEPLVLPLAKARELIVVADEMSVVPVVRRTLFWLTAPTPMVPAN